MNIPYFHSTLCSNILLGLSDEEDLHQYVVYETPKNVRKGPKRINLNDPAPIKGMEGYAPPASLAVHLSKISMPELQPRTTSTQVTPEKGGKKDDRKADKLAKQDEKEREKAAKKEKERKGKERARNGAAGSSALTIIARYRHFSLRQQYRRNARTTRRSSRNRRQNPLLAILD